MRQYNVGSPMERVAIDIAGPFPETDGGNKYILVAMDYFTKWTEAYAIPNQEASTVAEVLVKEFFSRFGVPLEIHSDQGRNFESALFQNVCRLLGINKTRTTPLHPQSDGMVERMNRTMGKYLSKVVSEHQRDWDQYIHLFLMAYRSAINETTGQTPSCLMFGREIRLPCDLQFGRRPLEECTAGEGYVDQLKSRLNDVHELARRNIQIASDRMKNQYDGRAKEGQFEVGDLVWLYNPQRRRGMSPKLQRHWEGPYKIIKKINDVVYRIHKPPKGKPRIVHINRLAPYAGTNEAEGVRRIAEKLVTASKQLSFRDFMADYSGRKKVRFGVTSEVQQDLFAVPSDVSIAHCVAQDLRMDRGLAVVFRSKYGRIEELQQQGPKVGKALRLEDKNRSLFYLVTKRYSYDKPTYHDMWRALDDMKKHVLHYDVKKLAIPKIGCGLDQLDWKIVRSMIEALFQGTGVEITVCSFNYKTGVTQPKTVDCYFFRQGHCAAGEECRFLHGPVYRRQQQVWKDEQQKRTSIHQVKKVAGRDDQI